MEFNDINQLLDKYWAGESSLKEEETLQSYFQQANIAEEHRQFAPLFQYFTAEKETLLSDDFDQRLLQQLEEIEEEGRIVPLQRESRRRRWSYISGAAAAIALLFSCWFLLQKPADPVIASLTQQEVAEAKIAYQQAKDALLMLSTKMNKGTQAAVNGLNELDQATQVVSGN